MIRKITIEQYGKHGNFFTLYVDGILKHGDLTKFQIIKVLCEMLELKTLGIINLSNIQKAPTNIPNFVCKRRKGL